MEIKVEIYKDDYPSKSLTIIGTFCTKDKEGKCKPQLHASKSVLETFKHLSFNKNFSGNKSEIFNFNLNNGNQIKIIGLGEKSKCDNEVIRKTVALAIKQAATEKHEEIIFDLESFNGLNDLNETIKICSEAIYLTTYAYDKYKSKKSPCSIKKITFATKTKAIVKLFESATTAKTVCESVNFARDLVNEAPNVLHSEHYAKIIEDDAKKHLKAVKIKILGKSELKKENMNLFLAVNAGSAYDPKLVHLTYTPKKSTPKTKHYAVVGKGLTFDTGGYSLKPGTSMMGMKFDMAGSASVYGAFRAAVLLNSPHKLTCILAITDNAVSSHATFPDSIVKGRNGKTVEILNTDAEGRLVLADALDYACDQKPDAIIDAATLTGACLVALGSEMAGLMGNNQKLMDKILESARKENEYVWQLPLIEEFTTDMKSKIADLKNIGSAGKAGSSKGGAFLQEFIKNDIAWAHLDIAGIADSATHLPYCQSSGASGTIIRTIHHFLMHG